DNDRRNIPADFLWLDDTEDHVSEVGFLSWYDARRAHPSRTEYRLYYPSNAVTNRAKADDSLFIATKSDGSAIVIVTLAGSTLQSQLMWLFGLNVQADFGFTLANKAVTGRREIGYVEDTILAILGIEAIAPSDAVTDLILQFGNKFPATRVLSALARDTAKVSPLDDPDGALLAYMAQEEALFRALEKIIVRQRLASGFDEDVDDFLQFSLSVQNRRKSRAGHALGNHVEAILLANTIAHKREATTEKRNGPDFLFPNEAAYHDVAFAAKKPANACS
ncbi:MAG: type II restriction endonuclease, partial [Cypionkella sp.]